MAHLSYFWFVLRGWVVMLSRQFGQFIANSFRAKETIHKREELS